MANNMDQRKLSCERVWIRKVVGRMFPWPSKNNCPIRHKNPSSIWCVGRYCVGICPKKEKVICKTCQPILILHSSIVLLFLFYHKVFLKGIIIHELQFLNVILLLFILSPSLFIIQAKKMNPKAIYFPIIIAIFGVLASTHPPLTYFNGILDRYSTALSFYIVNRHHYHHHDTDDDKAKQSLCDKFTPNFPTIDPSNTSILCVDHNGCCNFTTVQAAVDSIGNFSAKRSLIWITNGIYL